MKPKLLLFFLAAFLFVSTGIVGAMETNGFLVFEVDRYAYNGMDGRASGPNIQQRFKVPLTEEFMSNFRNDAGFCCSGGNLKTNEGSTSFCWWIHKTSDNHWHINMWGAGGETINGVKPGPRPTVSQYMTIKKWEDLDMSYMFSYPGINIEFTAKYVAAKDIEAEGSIPAAPVQEADHTTLFSGDDPGHLPLEIRCFFQ